MLGTLQKWKNDSKKWYTSYDFHWLQLTIKNLKYIIEIAFALTRKTLFWNEAYVFEDLHSFETFAENFLDESPCHAFGIWSSCLFIIREINSLLNVLFGIFPWTQSSYSRYARFYSILISLQTKSQGAAAMLYLSLPLQLQG